MHSRRWQTETGWSIVANCVGLGRLPVKPGSPTKAVPGWDVQVLDSAGHPVKPREIGALCCKLPLPPVIDRDVETVASV